MPRKYIQIDIPEFLSFIKRSQPVHISTVTKFLKKNKGTSASYACVFIKRMIEVGKIERGGLKNVWLTIKEKS